MRGTVARKIRQYSKRNWIEYVQAIEQWPLSARLRFSWYILFKFKAKKRKPIQ